MVVRADAHKMWNKMSPVDRSFLVGSYERYKNLLTSTNGVRAFDNFSEWLNKRGILKDIVDQ